jgi:NAD(P)-dependent dehydrogenase (short-subunit alcohol dehydrogenase family)
MSLKNKTLFITGASRGIGLAIALRAARDGANIAIVAKTVTPDPRLPGTIFTAARRCPSPAISATSRASRRRWPTRSPSSAASTSW